MSKMPGQVLLDKLRDGKATRGPRPPSLSSILELAPNALSLYKALVANTTKMKNSKKVKKNQEEKSNRKSDSVVAL